MNVEPQFTLLNRWNDREFKVFVAHTKNRTSNVESRLD